MSNLIIILGDQLSLNISSLRDIKRDDIVMMAEVNKEAKYANHHKKKLVLIFSAMRNFAETLRKKNISVSYYKLDEFNFIDFTQAVDFQIKKNKPKNIIITEPSEYRVLQEVKSWNKKFNIVVDVLGDDRFIASHYDFTEFTKNRKTLLMEFFYRRMRLKTKLLLENGKPVGGKWNFDSENRKTISPKETIKTPKKITPNKITLEVIEMVKKLFNNNFGDIENFSYATTADEANILFEDFLENRLKNFGDYQDSMSENFVFAFHSNIALYLNIGLLQPLDVCKAVEKYYYEGKCLINSAEGFIRQVIGWREYIRGIYWFKMPEYENLNFFSAKNKLPDFFWDENKTQMNCLRQVVKQTRIYGYSHHIQRLMITGNFSLLASIDPVEINHWYLSVYVDAFHWVELPNTSGMAIYADGGIVASKPYAASGNYINKMSDFCKNCQYDNKTNNKNNSCPFNYLYWNFLHKNKKLLENNQRLKFAYSNLKRKTSAELDVIKKLSSNFLSEIRS